MAASLTAPKLLTPGSGSITGGKASSVKVMRILVGAAATNDVVVDAQATYQIASIPAGTVVLSVLTRVIAAFSTFVTIGIGDGASTSGWLATTKIAPTSAETAGLYQTTQLATADAYAGGKKYLADDTIDAIIGGATPAAGQLEVLIHYVDAAAGTA